MENVELNLSSGKTVCPIVLKGTVSCPQSCKSKECKLKGGAETPVMDVSPEGIRVNIFCYTGANKIKKGIHGQR